MLIIEFTTLIESRGGIMWRRECLFKLSIESVANHAAVSLPVICCSLSNAVNAIRLCEAKRKGINRNESWKVRFGGNFSRKCIEEEKEIKRLCKRKQKILIISRARRVVISSDSTIRNQKKEFSFPLFTCHFTNAIT